ncbi:hypothetical protein KY358_01630 [Candidatus Woesearchaeota archaeon]|nr:hypothetical protein [Candidatus Woesearchaeota archaeon]
MGRLVDMGGKIKRYYKFNPAELRGFIISIAIISFIISFDEWGKERFSLATGLFNWFNAALIVTLVLIIYNFVQKLAGWSVGYNTEYKMWMTGLLIGLVFAFISRGRVWVLLPGGIMIHHLAGHRIGHFRYGLGYFQHGMIAVAGTFTLITIAAFFKIVNAFAYSALIEKLIVFCLIFAVYDILPIPPLSGNRLYFGSRMAYAFIFSVVIAAAVLLLLDINVLMAVFGSIAIGVICWLLYYLFFERKAWSGPWPKR